MTKIGRNASCPCGSGRKFKKCCLSQGQLQTISQEFAKKSMDEVRTVRSEVAIIKQAAMEKLQAVRISGVLILFSTIEGDAWLLEITDGDALQLTKGCRELEVIIDENPENTLIEWSHTFAIKNGKFTVEGYKDKMQTVFDGYPVKKITAAIMAIRKQLPPGYAGMVHLPLEVREEGSEN